MDGGVNIFGIAEVDWIGLIVTMPLGIAGGSPIGRVAYDDQSIPALHGCLEGSRVQSCCMGVARRAETGFVAWALGVAQLILLLDQYFDTGREFAWVHALCVRIWLPSCQLPQLEAAVNAGFLGKEVAAPIAYI